MLNYKNSSTSYNKLNNSDLPTAVKSNYYDYSPHSRDIGTPSLKSPSRSIMKLQEAKNSISSMIHEMSNKKNQNNNAIERVRGVNSEALEAMNNNRYQQHYTPKKSQRDQIRAVPQYTVLNPEGGYATQFNLEGGDDGNYDIINHPGSGSLSLEQQNIELRRALNQQIRENNELLKRIRYLQLENEDLKNQLGQGREGAALYGSKGLRSTNYNSVNYGDASNNLGQFGSPRNNKNIDFAEIQANLGNPNYQSNYNYADNFKIASVRPTQNQGNYQNAYNYPDNFQYGPAPTKYSGVYHGAHPAAKDLVQQLNELKNENQRLRQNAIDMLKSTH